MSIGAISISTNQKNEPSGSPFPADSAHNGVSVDAAGKIVLGNDVGGVLATLLNNREVPMSTFSIDWSGGTSQFTNAPTTGRAVVIDTLQTPGVFMHFNNPSTFTGAVPFQWLVEKVANPIPGDGFNTPMKWGWNINTAFDPTVSGIHYSLEPNFRPGGARMKEAHLEVTLPNGDVSRLSSATFIEHATMATSSNLWFFSATGIEFRRLDTSAYFASFGVNLTTNNVTIDMISPSGAAGMRYSISGSSALVLMDSFPQHQQFQWRFWDTILFADLVASFGIVNNASPGRSVLFNVFVNDAISILRSGSTMTLNFENSPGSIPVFLQVDVNTGEYRTSVAASFFPTFFSSGAEAMRIPTTRNVLINDTTDTGARLHVNGNIDTSDPGSGAGKWQLGKVIAAASVLDATQYVEVAIDGVVVKLAVIV